MKKIHLIFYNMKSPVKSFVIHYIALSTVATMISLISWPLINFSLGAVLILNTVLLLSMALFLFYFWHWKVKQIQADNIKEQEKLEQEYQYAIKNIYDEHIFS